MRTIEDLSIQYWIVNNHLVTESGKPFDIKGDHFFWFDYLGDFHPWIVLLKPPQIGASIGNNLKMFYICKKLGLNLIYTLPTARDRDEFVKTKVNPLINNNPVLKQWLTDTDNLSQKQLGNSWIYYRGTFNEKDAMMFTSDLNIHDEDDASNQTVIKGYQSRYQHSDFKGEWHFSHPSDEDYGVDEYWKVSDQRHWFIRCEECKKEQYLNWPESICLKRQIYQCKHCFKPLRDEDRRKGRWVAKRSVGAVYCQKCNSKQNKCSCIEPQLFTVKYHGYWVNLLMCAWVPATEIIEKSLGDPVYFYNKVLGLPYASPDDRLTRKVLFKNLTTDIITPGRNERVIMGLDTGKKLDYVMGTDKGLFFHGDTENYDELDQLMVRWPKMIVMADAGGDMIGIKEFAQRWPGRVFMVRLMGDRKGTDKPSWNDDEKIVQVDRNKYITQVVGEFVKGRIPLQGDENDWYEYALDWENLRKKKIFDNITGELKGHKWVRKARDHRALATIFYRVGIDKFGQGDGTIIPADPISIPKGITVGVDGRIPTENPFIFEKDYDWRDV